MTTSVNTLILNYRRFKDTESCINSLLKSDLPANTRIIVLDNSPDNLSVDYLKNKFPKIKIIKNSLNLGFAAGNNVGIRSSLKQKASHILLLNPDTIVPRHFLKPLLKHQSQANAAILAPALKHRLNGRTFYGLEGSVSWLTSKTSHINLPALPQKSLRNAEFVSFACVLIPQTTFKKIGLLNQDFFMYLEDVDFCLRAKKKGLKVFLDPSVVVKHSTSSSFTKETTKLIISLRSQLRFIFLWLPYPQRLLAYLYTIPRFIFLILRSLT